MSLLASIPNPHFTGIWLLAGTVELETGQFAPVFGKRTTMKKLLSAFVLAGDYSRRYGTDKALHQYQGQALIKYPLTLLSEKTSIVSIVAKDEKEYQWLGYPVVKDIVDQQSPLVGILSGLLNSTTDWNYFQACDMPFMQPGIFNLLMERVEEISEDPDIHAFIPLTDFGLQPLAAFYRKNSIDTLREAIHDNLSVKDWINMLHVKTINFGNAMSFKNVSQVEDLNVVPA